MKHGWLSILAAGVIMSAPAHAASEAAPKAPDCAMQGNISLIANFAVPAKSFEEAKAKFGEMVEQLNASVAKAGIKLYQLQSTGYSISSQPAMYVGQPDASFQLNGSVNYMLDSTESAFKLGNALIPQRFQVSVNTNRSYSTSCPYKPGN